MALGMVEKNVTLGIESGLESHLQYYFPNTCI